MTTKRPRPEANGAMKADGHIDESSLPVKILKTTLDTKPISDRKAGESEHKSTDISAVLQESVPTTLDPEEVLLSALEQEISKYDDATHMSGVDAKAGNIAVIGNVALPHVLEDDDYDESEESE